MTVTVGHAHEDQEEDQEDEDEPGDGVHHGRGERDRDVGEAGARHEAGGQLLNSLFSLFFFSSKDVLWPLSVCE